MKKIILLTMFLSLVAPVAHAQGVSAPESRAQITAALGSLASTLQSVSAEYSRDEALLQRYRIRLGMLVQSVGYLASVPFGSGTVVEADAEQKIVSVTAASVVDEVSTIRADLQAIDARRAAEAQTLARIAQNIRDIATQVKTLAL